MRVKNKLPFTTKQLDRISNILDNIGSIFFGATVLTPLITDFDRASWLVIVLGLVVTAISWIVSVWLVRQR